nr:MAG TPA: baseplate wedge subunit [Caudoviricetes sp.]
MKGMCAKTGKVLEGLAHLEQSVTDILSTPVGSRLERRSYGSDIPELIDQPDTPSTRIRIFSAAAHALSLWEPRLRITSIQMVSLASESKGKALLQIDGQTSEQTVSLSVAIGGHS